MDPCKFYKCLADDTRLKSLLLINTVNEACVCDLMAALELDQPKISRHLAELRKCGILLDERRGKWVYYKLHPSLPTWAKNVIEQTANHNSDYHKDALTKLNVCLSTTETCC
ncbi:metalloregulator ArsR/SmtB family transcription factor [Paraglaciecola hydrolytica]|uniref:ArsR family transcriptional regulator n=1 Tax=Paraglaciecola hydrolytica TaxID=1799789 RepID=A0A148KMC6_9ALTE|nr:metalloregulator ArsR/SmtB family transcription factor [Paraglaciecola hydrolytica]KXI27398.1 ArsR family transcriptional regulator [Paraglaciecola hydrolytica]